MSTYRGSRLKVWKNPSHSTPGKYYETVQWSNGELTCNCRGWVYPKNGNPRTCTHVRSAEGEVRRSRLAPPPKPKGIGVDFTEVVNNFKEEMERIEAQVRRGEAPKASPKIMPVKAIHPEGRKFKRLIRVAQCE